jgi:hypothetical protein
MFVPKIRLHPVSYNYVSETFIATGIIFSNDPFCYDLLCDLLVRGLGSIPGATRFSEK